MRRHIQFVGIDLCLKHDVYYTEIYDVVVYLETFNTTSRLPDYLYCYSVTQKDSPLLLIRGECSVWNYGA